MFVIIDNFYADPDAVREMALRQNFNVSGNYPGLRTEACSGQWFEDIQKTFAKIVGRRVTYFPREYNTAFQFTTEDAKTWVHHDSTDWAAVLYLTPDAPLDSGTAIYKHKHTGIYKHSDSAAIDFNEYASEPSDWEIVAEAKNMYNRLVIYDGNYYHRSVVPGFGKDKHDARLFQTFFFNTGEAL